MKIWGRITVGYLIKKNKIKNNRTTGDVEQLVRTGKRKENNLEYPWEEYPSKN